MRRIRRLSRQKSAFRFRFEAPKEATMKGFGYALGGLLLGACAACATLPTNTLKACDASSHSLETQLSLGDYALENGLSEFARCEFGGAASRGSARPSYARSKKSPTSTP